MKAHYIVAVARELVIQVIDNRSVHRWMERRFILTGENGGNAEMLCCLD
jgi:hypothetical protein